MSGVQATLALVLLRYLRRGGKQFRRWVARVVLQRVRLEELEQAREHHIELYDTRVIRAYFEREDMRIEAYSNTETAPRNVHYSRPLLRVAFYSHAHGCNLVRWRRVGRPESGSLYTPLPAPAPKRRSTRLGIKRNERRKKLKK